VPAEVVLDTSFIVDALLPSQERHVACRDYLERLVVGDTFVIFNRLLELELAEAAYKIALKERFGKRRFMEMRGDGRALRRASRLAGLLRESWSDVLDTLAWGRVELSESIGLVPDLMKRGLASYDAVHAATALTTNVRYLKRFS
jgi:predicted nucleic acid-binding protein